MISEERLRQAAHVAGDAMLAALPAPEECQHDFSAAFERKMRRVLRRGNHPGLYRGFQRVASFLLALLVGCGVWLSVDAQAREAFFGWVSERLDNAQHYFFDGPNANGVPNVRYRFAAIPAGYREVDTFEAETFVETTYIDDINNVYLSFGYLFRETDASTSEIIFVTDDMEKIAVQVHNTPADCYLDGMGKTGNLIVWRDMETDTLLYISGYFSGDELIQMAETVILEKN